MATNESNRDRGYTLAALVGGAIVTLILVAGTIWIGRAATRDTEQAVRSVSMLYLDELAGRREQVVASNLQGQVSSTQTAVDLLEADDLVSVESLAAYQMRMKQLFGLERFAFVDQEGLVHTSTGSLEPSDGYPFDHTTIHEAEIHAIDLGTSNSSVLIALPVDIAFQDTRLVACFTQRSMEEMLRGVSLQSDEEGTTFCNLYTRDGVALTDTVLGGLAQEDNLLGAMAQASYDEGFSYEVFLDEFSNGRPGEVSFTYQGIRETLSYVPVEGTDWLLTYLIRESVISGQIGSISQGIIRRSVIQSILTVAALLATFALIVAQTRRNARLVLEKETFEAESRVKREELEHRIELQEQLLAQEREQERQDQLITALSSDYWSVYYLWLDTDEGVCYQSHADIDDGFSVGDHFRYLESVTSYANRYVTDAYREEFLRFIQPDNIRAGLAEHRVISYRYLVERHGRESWEMVRFAGVRHPEDRDDHLVHSVGACFTNVDDETRAQLAQNQALSEALEAAEQANKAKTAFLSNMSHEIRTPMNAIIGLDNIALNDPETPEQVRGYLEKIGDSAEHLLGLINDILDMSRIESGRMVLRNEEFSFPKLLESINTMFSGQCSERGLDYQCHIAGQVDDYYVGDVMKLRQVLINILGNAVKFTPAPGKVELGVERKAKFDGKTTLEFTISDTGIGMSEDFLPHIFDTFAQEDASATNRYGSSGLGLAITKSIVELMNGNIEVTSEKGRGSTFRVVVTLADSHHEGATATFDDVRPQDLSVLVIDDDPVAREHAKLVLEKAGIAAEVAEDGPTAIEMVRLRHARRDPYNLILVDWQMPDMDGVETTRQIRSIIGNESAIVILTAYRWDDVLEEATSAGVDSFIAKPLFAASVLEEFKSAMKRKGVSVFEAGPKAELAGRRVLLAEDMEVNAEIMGMVLAMRDMEVDYASNGRIAVEMFQASEPGHYDAILMDLRMPEMDGLEATRVIRAMDRPDATTVPIVALTANAFDEDVQRSLQAGLNAHLSKPVEPDTLFETLEGLIKE